MKTLSLSRILVPVDFSPRSVGVVEYAERIATHFGSELILLHVIQPLSVDFAMSDMSGALMQDFTTERRVVVEKQLSNLGPQGSSAVPVRRLLLEGEPADQIVECAQKEGAGLIVMPTQGRSRVRQFLIGSVTAKVLHEAEVPVLTGVHLEQVRDFPAFGVHKLLCAVDLGRQSEVVAGMARDLAQAFQAQTTLLHVAEPDSGAEERIDDLLKATGLDADVVIANGDPHKIVGETAARLSSDLVIIGRGSSNTMIGRLRAQAYGIVRQSPCPVLSV